MNRIFAIGMILSMIASFGCKKEEITFSKEPKILLKNTYPTQVTEFTSPITFTIEYEDGDGDIGFTDPDSYTIVLHDTRLTEPDWYYVKPLAPVGSDVPIKGELNIVLNSIFLLGSGSVAEFTTFNIRLRDRAGNWSNIVTSPTITINP